MRSKICFNKSVGVIVGIVALIIIGTFVVTRLTLLKTSTNSRASEPQCTGLLETDCTGNCVWENNQCVSLVSNIVSRESEQLEICPSGLECSTDFDLDYDWDTAGYAPCKKVDLYGNETKMRCCPKGLVRSKIDGQEPGTCECPKGKQKGKFTSAEDEGTCIEYKKVTDKNDLCLSTLSCLPATPETAPRGSLPCFNKEGINEYCCQYGDTITIPTDASLKSFCKENSWYSMW